MDESVEATGAKKVSWGSVIGGILIALLSAIVVVPGSMFAGAWVAQQFGRGNTAQIIGAVVAALVAALVMLLLWWLCKRSNRDLATGVLIGGVIVVIISGGCGAILTGFSVGH